MTFAPFKLSFLGYIFAGWPSAAEEELVDTMSLDEYLIENKESSFMMRVKSDSMSEAGILQGDMVIVERGRAPKPGNIVIARIDGEFTMKFYRKNGGEIYLEGGNRDENGKSEKIFPNDELRVEAVLKAVVRKY